MTSTTERVNIALPIGLRNKVKELGYNLSAVCADALQKRVIEHNHRVEYEVWCKVGLAKGDEPVAAQKEE
jgi:post-segregation antitoxin (ccd killing protein)